MKTLVYYYCGYSRIATDEIDRLPEPGEGLTFWPGRTFRVIRVSDGHISDGGHCYTRVDCEEVEAG